MMAYRKLEAHERKMHGPRFRGEKGQWFHALWIPWLEFVPEEDREPIPDTRPDEDAWYHEFGCQCDVCKRPVALWWKRAKVTHEVVPRVGPRSPRQ